jgi:hypothetical protein
MYVCVEITGEILKVKRKAPCLVSEEKRRVSVSEGKYRLVVSG